MGAKELIMKIVNGVVDFMKNNTEPFFGLTLLTAVVGTAVVEVVSDYFTRDGGDD